MVSTGQSRILNEHHLLKYSLEEKYVAFGGSISIKSYSRGRQKKKKKRKSCVRVGGRGHGNIGLIENINLTVDS